VSEENIVIVRLNAALWGADDGILGKNEVT
jgi:hypothetical protein